MGTDVFDEDNIVGVRLAWDISNLPVQSIVESVDVSGIANPIPVDAVNQPINITEQYDFKYLDLDRTADLTAGNSDIMDVTPPLGYAYIIKGMNVSYPANGSATSGTHELVFWTGDSSLPRMKAEANYNATASYVQGMLVGDVETEPTNDVVAALIVQNLVSTQATPLKIGWTNNTDATYTGVRECEIFVNQVRRET